MLQQQNCNLSSIKLEYCLSNSCGLFSHSASCCPISLGCSGCIFHALCGLCPLKLSFQLHFTHQALPQPLDLIVFKGKLFSKCVLLSFFFFLFLSFTEVWHVHTPPKIKEKETAESNFETGYSIELHTCCSLDGRINSLYTFYFAVQNCSCALRSFLWHWRLYLLLKENGD